MLGPLNTAEPGPSARLPSYTSRLCPLLSKVYGRLYTDPASVAVELRYIFPPSWLSMTGFVVAWRVSMLCPLSPSWCLSFCMVRGLGRLSASNGTSRASGFGVSARYKSPLVYEADIEVPLQLAHLLAFDTFRIVSPSMSQRFGVVLP